MEDRAAEAVTITNEALQQVSSTDTSLDRITADILNIRQLDPTRITELRNEVRKHGTCKECIIFFKFVNSAQI